MAIGRSAYDRFRGRLLWPIRDASGDTIGFGARRIFDDDKIEAKYLNTPETPIYKKSQVLYGIDLARRDMARSSQAVVVEGYTDVMACHLAGVADRGRHLRHRLRRRPRPGAAPVPARPRGVPRRGDLHLRRRRRRAEGRAAGVRRRPELRLPDLRRGRARRPRPVRPADQEGRRRGARAGRPAGAALPVRARQRRRQYDLDRADGRVDAVREAARLVSSIRDKSKVDAFSRELAGMVGVDIEEARAEVTPRRQPPGHGRRRPRQRAGRRPAQPRRRRRASSCPTCATRGSRSSARPSSWSSSTRSAIGRSTADVGANDFTHPTYRAVWELVAAAGGPAAGAADAGWADQAARRAPPTPRSRRRSARSASSRCSRRRSPTRRTSPLHVFRLLELTALRRIADLKSRLQRTNPVEHAADYNRMFGELAALEQHRRTLRDRTVGAS